MRKILLFLAVFLMGMFGHAYIAAAAMTLNGIEVATSTASATSIAVDVTLTDPPDGTMATLCATFSTATGAPVPTVSGSLSGAYTSIGTDNYIGTAVLGLFYGVAAGNETVTATISAAGPMNLICQPLKGLASPWFVDFGTGLNTSTTSGSITLSQNEVDSIAFILSRIQSQELVATSGTITAITPFGLGGAFIMYDTVAQATGSNQYDWTVSGSGNIGSIGAYAIQAPDAPPAPPDFSGGATSSVEQSQQNLFNGFVIFFAWFFGMIWLLRKH